MKASGSGSDVTIASLQIFALFVLWSPSGEIWWQAEGTSLALMTTLYGTAWLLLGKAMADAGMSLQTGSLGWMALLRNKKPVYPKMPERGLFQTFTPAHLCHVYSDLVDGTDVDTGPACRSWGR